MTHYQLSLCKLLRSTYHKNVVSLSATVQVVIKKILHFLCPGRASAGLEWPPGTKRNFSAEVYWGYVPTKFHVPRCYGVPGIVDQKFRR